MVSKQPQSKQKVKWKAIKDQETNKAAYVYPQNWTNKQFFLGKGQYGQVFKGFHYDQDKRKMGSMVAIKTIELPSLNKEKNKDLADSIKHEIEIFKSINSKLKGNPYVVFVEDIYQTKKNVYVIMEYCKHGDLKQIMKQRKKQQQIFEDKEVLQIINCLLNGCSSLNQINIWHRDIKPSNILIKKNMFKICDYGMTRIVDCNPDQKEKYTLVGTPLYACPQILKGEKYSAKADVFSIGVILFELLFNRAPWHGTNIYEHIKFVTEYPLKIPQYRTLSEEMTWLVTSLLEKKESKRPLAGEVLKHAYFQKLLKSNGLQ